MSQAITKIISGMANSENSFAVKAQVLIMLSLLAPHVPVTNEAQEYPAASARIRNFIEWMKEHYESPIGMAEAIAHTGMSKAHFHRCFRDATGTSLSRYLNRQRISVVRNMLQFSERIILDIALSCGFQSTSRFYKVFF